MPPRTTTTPAGKAASKDAAAPPDAGLPELKTFAEHLGSRAYEPRGPQDDKRQIRSFSLPTGVVERLRATADGIQHMAYGTALEGKVPATIAGLAAEAFEAICSYYEEILNNGEEFRRVRKLPPGPSKEGARVGAEKRAATRAAKAGASTKSKD